MTTATEAVRLLREKFGWEAHTEGILERIMEERERQVARYGHNDECALGMGPQVKWLGRTDVNLDLRTAQEIEAAFRAEYVRHDTPTWMHLIREEVAEAFAEDDREKLVAELIQVAALAVSCIEAVERGAC